MPAQQPDFNPGPSLQLLLHHLRPVHCLQLLSCVIW